MDVIQLGPVSEGSAGPVGDRLFEKKQALPYLSGDFPEARLRNQIGEPPPTSGLEALSQIAIVSF